MVGITSRPPCRLALIAFSMMLVLVLAAPEVADSRHRRPKQRNSLAGFLVDPPAPAAFTCAWEDSPRHDYTCAWGTSPTPATFRLLELDPPDPDETLPGFFTEDASYPYPDYPEGWGGAHPLASPDIAQQFTCSWETADPAIAAAESQCSFTYNAYTHRFRVADIVSIKYDPEAPGATEQWVMPCDGIGPCPEEDPPPDTRITEGPARAVASRSALLRFVADEPNSTFACRLDAGGWEACSAVKGYDGLSEGLHAFEVRATDDRGKVDASPAQREWRVDVTGPHVLILGRRAGPNLRGVARVRVMCQASEASGPCVGRLRLATARRFGRAGRIRLGAKPLRLTPGQLTTARVRLSRRGRVLLGRLGRVRVLARVRAFDALGNVKTSSARFRLRAP
jgi:hypothetical protein